MLQSLDRQQTFLSQVNIGWYSGWSDTGIGHQRLRVRVSLTLQLIDYQCFIFSMRKITYEMHPDDDPPKKFDYIVSITNKGIGSIYLVHSIRIVKQRVPSLRKKYSIEIESRPDLKELTVLDFDHINEEFNVWVKGITAHPLYWIKRKVN